MQLRDYQIAQLEFLKKDNNSGVVQSPTGTGKSVVMKEYIDWFSENNVGSKICVVTPNQTLNYNIKQYLGDKATLAHTGFTPDLSKKILVTTYHSAKKYIDKFKPNLIIGDELHRAEAKTYHEIMKYAGIRKGFTATPNRHDGKGLDSLFADIHISPQISWFIENEYLSDYDLIAVECPLFLSNHDDYISQQEIFGSKPKIEKTVQTFLDHAQGQTLVFCTTITHGIKLKEEFLKKNIDCRFVCSDKPQSDNLKESLELFKNGQIQLLINCQMFIEGVDIPQIETLILAVFSFSLPKFLQMVGRLLRPLPGVRKKLIDLTGNIYYHGNPKSAFFDWSLTGFKNENNISNKSSNWEYCYSCEELLFRKIYLLEPTNICCLNCGATQYVLPPQNRKSVTFEGETFTLYDYSGEVLDCICTATKIAGASWKKYSKPEKLKLISSMKKLPVEIKIKAMLMTGASANTIEQYL